MSAPEGLQRQVWGLVLMGWIVAGEVMSYSGGSLKIVTFGQ